MEFKEEEHSGNYFIEMHACVAFHALEHITLVLLI